LWIVTRHHWLLPAIGVAVASAILYGAGGGWHWIAAVMAAVLALVAGILGGVVLAAIRNYRAIAANGSGICDGKLLTTWIDEQITGTAGKPCLTFGDLHHEDPLRCIRLAMMTTNVSHGCPV